MSLTKVSEDKELIKRAKYYYFLDLLNAKNKLIIKLKIHTILTKIQKIIKIDRKSIGEFPINKLYKGMIWVSLQRDAMEYVNEYIKQNKKFMRDLKYTYIPEEFFFQTILMNSKFSKTIVKNNLRYIEWNARNNIRPAILNESDYQRIVESDKIFMRKIGKESQELVKKIIDNFKEE